MLKVEVDNLIWSFCADGIWRGLYGDTALQKLPDLGVVSQLLRRNEGLL